MRTGSGGGAAVERGGQAKWRVAENVIAVAERECRGRASAMGAKRANWLRAEEKSRWEEKKSGTGFGQ